MQESTKTYVFVGGAALMVVAAAISHFASLPRAASDFAKVGEPFFEKFDSSGQAKSLEVVAVDPETVQRNRFKVAKVDGLWRIPSHENYPAEASARLATTASSIIGIERESLAGRGRKDFKRLGVVDPLSEEIDDPEEVGQRITLKDENDETLADYIIGKQVEDVSVAAADRPFASGQNRQTYFYVRHAGEQQTYIVPLELDLSTKFSDWIDPDLLRFDTANLSQVMVRNYSLEEQKTGNPLMRQRALVKKTGDVLALTKTDSNAWELAGVDPDKEEFADAGVTDMIGVLEELRIEDVRRKSTLQGKQLLTADLKVNEDPELRGNPEQFNRAIQQLVAELEDKGFNLAGTRAQLALVSNHGEIEFGTTDGMRYTLYVGAPFEEGGGEIKVSGAVDSDAGDGAKDAADDSESSDEIESSDKDADSDSEAKPEDGNEEAGGEAGSSDEDVKSRYMLVRVVLDPSLLTDQPEQPTKPEAPQKPVGYAPPPAPEDAADTESADEKEEDAGKSDDAENEESEDDQENDKSDKDEPDSEGDSDDEAEKKPSRSPEFEAYDVAIEQHEQAMVDYELGLTRYKDDQESFAKRVETAEKLEAELNERFNDWYYVISGENLKALQVSRDDLVSPKESAAVPPVRAPASLPDRPNISFDGGPDQAGEVPAVGSEEAEPSDATEMVPETPAAPSDPTESAPLAMEEAGTAAGVEETESETAAPDAAVPDAGTEVPVTESVPKPSTTPPPAIEPVPTVESVPETPAAVPNP